MNAVRALVGVLAVCGAALADEPAGPDLKKAMADIGCKVTSTEKVSSGEVHWADFRSGGRSYPLYAGLSGNKERVWVNIQLTVVDEATAARHPARLARLLALNHNVGPHAFVLATTSKTLNLAGSIEARGFENFRLRDLIDSMIANLEKTRPDWNIDWSKDPAPAAPPATPVTTRK